MSIAGRISPFFQLNELMFTPNPSIVWNVCVPFTVSVVPEPALTVTFTGADVTTFPVASRATAVNTCEPEGAVSDTENGALLSSGPAFAPSTWNCTVRTPAEPVALIENVRESAAPADGEVIETLIGAGVALKSTPVTSAPLIMGFRLVGLNVKPALL